MIRLQLSILPVFATLFLHATAAPEKLPPLELPVPPAALKHTRAITYGVYMDGGKIGWALDSREPNTINGKPCLVCSMEAHLVLKAMDKLMHMDMATRQSFDATPPHRLLRLESTQKMDGQTRKIVLTHRQDRSYAVEITEAGATRKSPDIDMDLRLTHVTSPELWIIDPARKPGDLIGTIDFDEDSLSLTSNTITLKRTSDWVGPGGKLPVWEAEEYDHAKKIEVQGCIRRTDGTMVKIEMAGAFEVRMEPEAVAKRKPDGQADVFLAFSIKSDRKLGPASDLTDLTVEIAAPEGRKAPELPATVNQTITPGDESRLTVKTTRGKGTPQAAAESDRADYLKSNLRYPADRPELKALAAKAISGAKSDAEKVRKLLAFTDTYLEDSYEVEALSVMDLIKSRKGECSAHALLFTTLARAAGIPAREAWGWMYMGDTYQTFGGHAWNEVILDGRWVPVDAVFQQIQLDAGHIQAGSGSPDMITTGRLTTGLRATVKSSTTK